MPSFPKNSPYRNRKLLDLAKDSPVCCICGEPNDGTVVPVHSDSLADGKGLGIKAHDIPAFGCMSCHQKIHGKGLTKDEKELLFYRGVYNTWLLCMSEGWLK